MRKSIFFFLVLSFFCCKVNAQMSVKDKNRTNQIKSMEFMQWKFTPKWYYYKWHWWNNPLGLGLHKNYVSKDRRNIYQYTPAIASTFLQKNEAEKQEEETEVVYKQELAKFADRSIDYAYTLSKSRRDELKSEFNRFYSEYTIISSDQKSKQTLMFEYNRILSNVKIINDSHMSNAKKREAYLQNEQELVELIALTKRLIKVSNILN